jgi:hypothetical protein
MRSRSHSARNSYTAPRDLTEPSRFKNTVQSDSSGLPVLVDVISPIGDQAAGGDEVAREVHRRQFVLRGQRDNQIAMTNRRGARRHDQTAIRRARESRDGTLDLRRVARVDGVSRQAVRSCSRRIAVSELAQAIAGQIGGVIDVGQFNAASLMYS